jgi:hypothetical protein
LTDTHACQTVDLAYLLQGVWAIVGSDDDAIVIVAVVDPLLTALTLAIDAALGMDSKARGAVDDLVSRP